MNQGFQRERTVQLFGTKEQKFLHFPGTKGQWDKLKILPREGTGWNSMSKSETGRGTGQYKILNILSCPVLSLESKIEKDVL